MKKWLLAMATGLSATACSPANPTISEDVKVIDVRTVAEWNSGHLEDAILLPMDQLAAKIENVVPDKSTQVVLYCRSGNRAGQMLSVMEQLGYEDVINAGSVNSAASLLDTNVVK